LFLASSTGMAPAFPLSTALRSRFFHIVCAAIALVISFYSELDNPQLGPCLLWPEVGTRQLL